MTHVAAIGFWLAAGLVGYTYLGFPLLVLLRARLAPRPVRCADVTPRVSIVMAAHNEAAAIGPKLDAIERIDYPAELLEVIVASDGSSDGTDEIVRGHDRVRLLSLPRVGKAAALNAAVGTAGGEVIAFTDANSLLAPASLRALVRPFADPAVGAVAGDQRYLPSSDGDGTASGERSYWDFDRRLKVAESAAGSTISATGALYAVRRSLVPPVPEGVTDDFATSTAVIARGYRLVFEPEAIAYEPVAASGGDEFGRKVRIMTRGLRGVFMRRELLDPRRHGFYAVQLFSHKVLRRLMALPLLVLGVSALLLRPRHRLYRALTFAQLTFYAAALAGLALRRTWLGRRKALSVPAYFLAVNAASLVALRNLATGRRIDRWAPSRGARGDGLPPILPRPEVATRIASMRGDGAPDVSVVVPVNARGDLDNTWTLLSDVARYRGPHAVEIILVVNNFAADEPPPPVVAELAAVGVRVIAMPSVSRRRGVAIPLAARVPGVEAATSEAIVLFDADVRVPDPTALVDWYVAQLRDGVGTAYTHVGFFGVRPRLSVRAKIALHHGSRWVKRVLLRIPTTRGSNYAVGRSAFLRLYADGLLADDLNVGPAMRAIGRRVVYSGRRELTVLTSARLFRGGWLRLGRYLWYRLRYNVRVLPVGADVAARTGREADPADRFDYIGREL